MFGVQQMLMAVMAANAQAHVSIRILIDADTENFNWYDGLVAGGWDELSPVHSILEVSSGVLVHGDPAITLDADFPAGSRFHLINNGIIAGKGGSGGRGGTGASITGSSGPLHGENGSDAILAVFPLSITNNGIIGGGGGGGGGGGDVYNPILGINMGAGGAGGGGASLGTGSAQVATWESTTATRWPQAGGNGGTETGGAGGAGAIWGGGGGNGTGGTGGTGGNLGQDGGSGSAATSSGLFSVTYVAGGDGGEAGAAIRGSSNVTFIVAGDIRGELVPASFT